MQITAKTVCFPCLATFLFVLNIKFSTYTDYSTIDVIHDLISKSKDAIFMNLSMYAYITRRNMSTYFPQFFYS